MLPRDLSQDPDVKHVCERTRLLQSADLEGKLDTFLPARAVTLYTRASGWRKLTAARAISRLRPVTQ